MPRVVRLSVLLTALWIGLLVVGLQLYRAKPLQTAYFLGRENATSGQQVYKYVAGTDFLEPLTPPFNFIQPIGELTENGEWVFFRGNATTSQVSYLYRVHVNGCCLRTVYDTRPVTDMWQPAGSNWVVFQTQDGLYRVAIDGSDLSKIADRAHIGGQYQGVTFSPDREAIAFLSGNSPALSIYQIRLADGLSQISPLTLPDPAGVMLQRWVGEWLILQKDATLYRVRLSGEELTRLTQNIKTDWNEWLEAALPGDWLDIRATNPTTHLNTVSLLHLKADEPNWTHPTDERQLGPIWFPTTGVAVYSEGSRLYQIGYAGETPIEIAEVGRTIMSLHASPDEKWVYLQAAGPNRLFRLYRVRPDGRDFQPLTDISRFVNFPQFSADMEWLMLIEGPPRNQTSRVIYSGPSDGKTLHSFLPGLMEINFVGWGPRLDKHWSPLLLISLTVGATILGITPSTRLKVLRR